MHALWAMELFLLQMACLLIAFVLLLFLLGRRMRHGDFKTLGVAEDHITRSGEEDNFWAAGPTGPCGPCPRFLLDQGPEFEGEAPRSTMVTVTLSSEPRLTSASDRQLRDASPELPHRNIDTGMGLERIGSQHAAMRAPLRGRHHAYSSFT